MKKSIIAIISIAVLCFSLAVTAMAAPLRDCSHNGACGTGFMCDEDGNFLDREAFEDKLDALIENGIISEDDREIYIEQYEWCLTNGTCLMDKTMPEHEHGHGRGHGSGHGAGRRH